VIRTKKERKRLYLSVIRLDFQPAENLIEETILDYVYRIKNGEDLLPVTVCFDGENYFLKDGFHRLEAVKRCGLKTIQTEVVLGTLEEMELEFRDGLRKFLDSLRADSKGKL